MRRTSLALIALVVAGVVAVAGAAGAPDQTPRRGGTVTFGPVAGPACLNPLATCGIGPQYNWVLEKVLPPAFSLRPDFTRRPLLVSGVTFTKTPPYTLTYSIRPQARWNDGVPVTARDFAFTQRALVSQLPKQALGPHGEIESIRVVDAKTVRVVLRTRLAGWRSLFPFVLPRHALLGEGLARVWRDRIENPKTGRAIGYGPFLVGRWERGERMTLVRNRQYWGPHTSYLDRLVVSVCEVCVAPPPAEVVESLESGVVDVTYARDTVVLPGLRRIRGVTVRGVVTNGWEHLTLRLEEGGHPALRNKLVRRAVAYGIDRAEIAERLWGDLVPDYRPLQSSVLLGSARGYAPNWSTYSYRPEVARSLLERAGCRRGTDGIYSCDGERLSLRFYTLAATTQRTRGLELMQAHLRRAGIEALPIHVSGNAFFGEIVPSGKFDAASFAWIGDSGFGQKGIYGCGASQNFSGYCQRLVTADLDQAAKIFDEAQRVRVLNRVDRRLAKDVPAIPLYQIPWVLAHKDTVRGIVSSPDNLFWNAENWWLAESR